MSPNQFHPAELRTLRRLATPEKVQRFLDDLAYNKEPHGPTVRSPRRVLRDRTAHCLEGAIFAAAALRVNGFPPLVIDLEAVRDTDHVVAVYRRYRHWGAVATSNYSGLRFRDPVYRTLRELALSYFPHYFNLAAEKTLRTFSRPVDLRRFDPIGWMTAEHDVWAIPEYLCEISHTPLLTDAVARRLTRMDKRLLEAGKVGTV
ncbi:MAG: hypothetical protein ACRD96_06495 [Bryobacteraceae bacterium]